MIGHGLITAICALGFLSEVHVLTTHPGTGKWCRSSKYGFFTPDDFYLHECALCYFYLFGPKMPLLSVEILKSKMPVIPDRLEPESMSNMLIAFNRSGLGSAYIPDAENVTTRQEICKTLSDDKCHRWTLCCKSARACCETQLQTPPRRNNNTCSRTWDGYGCWDDTEPGENKYIACPGFLNFAIPTRSAVKTCLSNGSWSMKNNKEWTDYTPCLQIDELKTSILLSLGCNIASLALLVPSVFIFLYYRSLRKQHRIRLHINFFVSFILSILFAVLWDMLVLYDKMTNPNVTDTLLYKNTASCKILSFLKIYFTMTNYMWMFCEGFYLHRLISNAFSPPKSLILLYIAGWGFPMIFSVTYAIIRGVWANEKCWAESMDEEQWIIYAPNLICLVVNLIFLCNILRILLTQLQAHPNEPSNFRRALKATFVLVPLFGVQLFVTIYRVPQEAHGALEYERFTDFVKTSQGFFVALIFCIFNGEVNSHLKRSCRHLCRKKLGTNSSRRMNTTISLNFNTNTQRYDGEASPKADARLRDKHSHEDTNGDVQSKL